MTTLSLQWVAAYSLQVAALVLCGMLLARLLGVREPRTRWACFESVLVLCVCLPFLQTSRPRTAMIPAPASWVGESFSLARNLETARTAHSGFPLSPARVIALLLVMGMAVRAAWLLLGFWQLYRLRRTSRPGPPLTGAVKALAETWRVNAQIRISTKVSGPITFGLRSAVILMPSRFEHMTCDTQDAVLRHELIHVRRKDWLFTVIEEGLLVALWFHPAVWWLVREIQLAREQAVDLEVIRSLDSRHQYVEALLEAAAVSARVRSTPAASFVWRGQLARRVAAIFAARDVSKRRRILSTAGVVGGTILVLRIAVVCLPSSFAAHAQQSAAEPIQIESGGDHLVRRAGLEYPRWVMDEKVEGLVDVEVSTDNLGRVLDAHVVSGPEALRSTVLRSVLDWQYDPHAMAPGTYEIAIRFTLPEPAQAEAPVLRGYPDSVSVGVGYAKDRGFQFAPSASEGYGKHGSFLFASPESESAAMEAIKQMVENTTHAENGELTGRIVQIRKHGAAESLDLHLPVTLGDEVNPEMISRVKEALRNVNRGLVLGLANGPDEQIVLHIFSGQNQRPR